MSPLVITLMVIAGLVVLLIIGYANHMVENSKLEKARLRADLNDRLRRTSALSDSLPGQFMTPELKVQLTRLQLLFCERLLPLDKSNAQLKVKAEELRGLVAQGEAMPIRNAPLKIANEAQAKEIRFQLETLHGQLTRSAKDGFMPVNDAKRWVNEIRGMLVQLHIEFFTNLGLQALQEGQPRQARLAFERGVQYLQKQPEPARYQNQLQQLQNQLARANALALDKQPAADEPSELGEALKSLDDEDTWKKKNIYD